MTRFVLYSNEIDKDSLPYVGGKGANLGEMTKAGFPVPQGFCVTTTAFKAFIETSNKMSQFFSQLDHVSADQLDEIRVLGDQIRNHLENLAMPREVEKSIVEAWKQNGIEKAYAVRSSATAEDLPSASFAGQQETYLNVLGQDQLLDSIRRCWASLFTDRAISYRAKNGFDHRQVLLSVVVQEMVFPDVSGIMFTADPISGNRTITSIDASFGLGEALVSGLVSADLYQVQSDKIIQKKISSKKIAIYSIPEGGTITKELTSDQQQAQALPDERIVELADLGKKIENHYGTEQDIEWCLANGKFYIVQSRPITSIYPIPKFLDSQLHILISLGHIQMMTDVMKPMAISFFSTMIPIAVEAGGRVFGDLTAPFGIKALRKRIPLVLKRMDEQLGTALEEVLQRPTTKFPHKRFPFRMVASIAFPVIKTVIKNVLVADPVARRDFVNRFIEESVKKCRQDILNSRVHSRIDAIKQNMKKEMFPSLLKVAPNWVSGELVSEIVKKLLQKWLGDTESIHALGRSLPGNVTSELGLMIGDLADIARQNPQLLDYLQKATDSDFYKGLNDIPNSEFFRLKLEHFMRLYGMRCPGEIDISKPRWYEVPTTLVSSIMSHIRTMAPGEHRIKFQEAAREAERVAKDLIEQVRKHKGSMQAKILKRLIHVYRNLGGLREHHKYLLIQHFGVYRQAILEEAQKLVHTGVLSEISDVFYLTINELQTLENGTFVKDTHPLIVERKQQEELNKKLTPPRVMTSDGEIITGRRSVMNAPVGALIGTPVSSGVIEGYAKIVLNPEKANLGSV
ncbi:phosphoenolpyruvate synthase, partial [Neobacillus fumarioli]|uniref:phosphoenolpyruvate synthase n=1 Tax=Neobacillus fumarioli TaxID=105229 RepID=UPI00082D77C8